MKIDNIEFDAWSSGQVGSKIWLCEELEKISIDLSNIWILGGWYGILSFLLLSRNNINQIRSFDIDLNCEKIADNINKLWLIDNWKFKAVTKNINTLNYTSQEFGFVPKIVINTSTEHIFGNEWFHNIPSGTLTIIQSTNQKHSDHYFCVNTVDELIERYKISSLLFAGTKEFTYPDSSFKRFMIIGNK